ncbi:GtrA family protein [Oligella ureolytica]
MFSVSLRSRLLLFLYAGGLATLAHWLVFILLSTYLLNYVAPVVATMIGAIVGAWINYLLQDGMTFGKIKNKSPYQGRKYVVAVMCSFILNAVLFQLFVSLGLMNLILTQIVTTALVTVVNYLLYAHVVFKAQPRLKEHASSPLHSSSTF